MPEEKSRRRTPYPAEMRERAVRTVLDHQDEYSSQWAAIGSVAEKLSINREILWLWVRRAETEEGRRPGLTTDERARMKALERENKELRRANEMANSTGDSYDDAMAEAFNCLDNWELIYPEGPWAGLDDVEFATMGYIDWFNHRRLTGEITDDNNYVTPAQFEAAHYRRTAPAPEAVAQ